MKSVLIIGMGKFGHHLCHNMVNLGNQVMVVDQREEEIEDLVAEVTSARIGDCTNEDVLRSLGVTNFDICFVCIGTNFQSSLEITSLLKELGAKYVVSKANRDIHAKFLLRNGADEVVYPDRDLAEKVAMKFSANHVFDYIEITDEYSIYEIPPMKEWVNKTIQEANIRAKYHINILGAKENGKIKILPTADYLIKEEEHLMIIGRKEVVDKILRDI